ITLHALRKLSKLRIRKCCDRLDKHNAHHNKQAHAHHSRNFLRTWTYGNSPADKECPQTIRKVESRCNDTCDVCRKYPWILYGFMHQYAKITMFDIPQSDLYARFEHVPDNKDKCYYAGNPLQHKHPVAEITIIRYIVTRLIGHIQSVYA